MSAHNVPGGPGPNPTQNAECVACSRAEPLFARRPGYKVKMCRECIVRLHPDETVTNPFNESERWPNGFIWREA